MEMCVFAHLREIFIEMLNAAILFSIKLFELNKINLYLMEWIPRLFGEIILFFIFIVHVERKNLQRSRQILYF